jgi:hypothetical protein
VIGPEHVLRFGIDLPAPDVGDPFGVREEFDGATVILLTVFPFGDVRGDADD